MPQILVNLTDASRRRVFLDSDFDRLSGLGEVSFFNPTIDDAAAYPALLAKADALLTCWGSRVLNEEELGARAKPLLVAHSAGSVRAIVAKDLLQQNVRLTQGAPAIAQAVAQYAVGLMIMALRQSVYRSVVTAKGEKADASIPAYRDLEALTIGLVGLSRVGTLTAELLPPFKVGNILAYDPYASAEKAAALGVELVADLDELLSRSDVVSLHAPVTPDTQNLIDARRVGLLKPGTAFINTARSQLTDQDALFARAMTGEIAVYVDVTQPEPLAPTHPAWQSPHIFITPHIAGPTTQTLRRMATYALDEIERFLAGQPLSYEVTYDRYDLLA